MQIKLGHIHELVRYPVKSMAGIPAQTAFLGWHGLQGDRRFAFRRLHDGSGFPWLTASKLPELLLYQPMGLDDTADEPLPTQVRTPEGKLLAMGSTELQSDISGKFGSPVELMQLKHGIFDEASLSVINLATIQAICQQAGQAVDSRRFRANVVLDATNAEPFQEDTWVNGKLVFGDAETGPMVQVTMRDIRCMMINLHPDTAKQDASIMKTVVKMNENNAGVYGTVVRTGELKVGDAVGLWLENN